MAVESQRMEEFRLTAEPYYLPLGNEVELFEAAYHARLPVMLKGPTGCGKTRFVEHMSWRLGRTLVTVGCHEDLTASDLVGKYTLRGDETVWQDGPLTTAVKAGGIAYLDEIVEARKDTTVVIHPLTDDRRVLPIEKKGEIIQAPDDFLLVISYNPGYQSVLKDLKHSTKQRFVAIDFDYPPPDAEEAILKSESGIDDDTAAKLVKIAEKVRNLRTHGLEEGVSTRLLVYAGQLIQGGVEPVAACEATICKPITDDGDMQRSIMELVATQF
ncbi:MAG: CbbQ/NirQ/NorQ/GpvN family protein [Acidimicrobiia bacterium]|jgi:nitric oxide reductase NorQ protein|nr:CbbQ/NirQ/NorQ/GpvN family protein [Acidimicrobiia bacterium]MCU0934649.1 CbbQ/NirQ/NorQ/GpvN family protein [Gammaproteobacteria bacterium]